MTTPILQLDEWESGQAQPEVVVNRALRWLECFAQLSAISMTDAAPPGSASDGDCYIVASGATGDWAGHDLEVALYVGTAWEFREAPAGSIAWVVDEDGHFRYAPLDSPPAWVAL